MIFIVHLACADKLGCLADTLRECVSRRTHGRGPVSRSNGCLEACANREDGAFITLNGRTLNCFRRLPSRCNTMSPGKYRIPSKRSEPGGPARLYFLDLGGG